MKGNPRRARRLQQHQEKARRWPVLNLVPLMDVFTILVFFFLVHSADVALTADRQVIELPESVAEQKPRETLVVMVTREMILLQGKPVVTLAEAAGTTGEDIADLRTALEQQRERSLPLPGQDEAMAREVTIMGDKSIPFALLKRVMRSCTRAGFDQISLSVIQRPSRSG